MIPQGGKRGRVPAKAGHAKSRTDPLGMLDLINGEMSEWFKVPVLKTGEAQASGGSNPSLSAIYFLGHLRMALFYWYYLVIWLFRSASCVSVNWAELVA